MKRNIAFSVLLIVFCSEILLADAIFLPEIEPSISSRDSVPNQLTEKKIDVRLYENWINDPCAYSLISVSYDNFIKSPGLYNSKSSSVMVILDEDQKNEQVKSEIAGSLIAERCDKLKGNLSIFPVFAGGEIEKDSVMLVDALGETIQDLKVDIFLRDSEIDGPKIFLKSVISKDGLIQIPKVTGSIRVYSFVVSHPKYGAAEIGRSYNNIQVRVPLVNKESLAYERAIRGKVVDPDGNPLKGAEIQCTNIRTLGEGLINSLNGDTVKAITNNNGEFSLYLPNKQNEERGYLISPGSMYQTRIEAPKELNLLPYIEPIVNDSEKIIVMERADHFRKIVFADENGIITDPEILKYINLNIMRSDQKMLIIGYSKIKDGGYFPLGEYKANMYISGVGEYEFEPLIVDENSPEEIVLSLPKRVIYSGQVVDGRTKVPMSGAFVIAFNSSSHGTLSMITPEQWIALHGLSLEPELDDPPIKPITDIYGIKKIVRTDENGHFQMSFIPGDIYGFIAFEENYLGIMHRRHKLVADENGIAEIPVLKLYPAAKVLVELQTEENISINPKWIIDAENNPAWVREFLANDDRSENTYTYDDWLENNQPQSFYIPADLNVKVKIQSPYHEQWQPIEIPETFNLAQGQIADLGSLTFEPSIEVFVQVINSRGEPVEGIPLRTLKSENYWGLAHNSDESGISSFYVSPSNNIQFGISYYGENGKYQKKTISCDVKNQEDTGKLFTLQLSDEILESLFDIGK